MTIGEPTLKEWLEPMLAVWAGQVRGMWSGEDGWPPRTVLARIQEEGAGASHGSYSQRVFEVYHKEGLAIRRAMEGMPYQARQALALHYLASGNAKEKAEVMQISKARYWSLIDAAYHYLAGHIGATTE